MSREVLDSNSASDMYCPSVGFSEVEEVVSRLLSSAKKGESPTSTERWSMRDASISVANAMTHQFW